MKRPVNHDEGTESVRVTKLTAHEDGHWSANVSVDGSTRTFHNRFGTWATDRRPRADENWPKGVTHREALPAIARALQRKLRRAERREKVPA